MINIPFHLNAFKRFIRTVPWWAFALVLLAIFVNSLYLYYKYQLPDEGHTVKFENGHWVYDYVNPGGPADKAGMQSGDRVVTINSMPIEEFTSIYRNQQAGDTVVLGFIRNGQEMTASLVFSSMASYIAGFLWTMYVVILLLCIASLYILYKKRDDKAARLFFIYLLIYAINQNSYHLIFNEDLSIFADIAFSFSVSMIGPILINFHLVFPKPSNIYLRFRKLPVVFYGTGFLFFMVYAARSVWVIMTGFQSDPVFNLINNIAVWWMIGTFLIAFSIAIYQFHTIKDTLSRNQLRLVITGSAFYFIGPIVVSSFPSYFYPLADKYPYFFDLTQGLGSLAMISLMVIAILRYRIWGTEIFIRRALLYLSATFIIILSYLLSIFLIDRFTHSEASDLTRFVILAVSVIIFLVLRDRIQHSIDRLFHRESYDSATVVSEFEEKLAGIYKFEDLRSGIIMGLDEIFHFKSLVFNLKKDELIYEPIYSLGLDQSIIDKKYKVTPEMERKLHKSEVFSPAELDHKLPLPEIYNSELIVPLIKDNKPFGFFLCGQKKSEKTYSMQDIRVLSLIAKRVIALFHTAALYQKDLDRQLMLERERARISQDMHDDIGAGLTKIAMISEAKTSEQDKVSSERMLKVATTARDMINRLNVIVWALNPRYDNLDSLVSYARRYFGEYLENFGISFRMEVPEEIPDLPVTPDFRRNAFYAWQEAIHNAVKHGVCSEVKIEVKMNGQTMQVIIADNGKGFDQARPGSGGNGLLNMKKRAEDLGGSFEIQSEPGKGTRVKFEIPVGG